MEKTTIISLSTYKHTLLCKTLAWLLIITFSITNLTYGYDRNDNLRAIYGPESGAVKAAVESKFYPVSVKLSKQVRTSPIANPGGPEDKRGSSRREALENLLREKMAGEGLLILFICTANLDRSAFAHMLTEDFIIKNELFDKVAVSSGGLGSPVLAVKPVLAKSFAAEAGVSSEVIRNFGTAQVSLEEIRGADVIFVAEEEHRQILIGTLPEKITRKVFLFNELLPSFDSQFGTDVSSLAGRKVFQHMQQTLERYLFPFLLGGNASQRESDSGQGRTSPITEEIVELGHDFEGYLNRISNLARMATSPPPELKELAAACGYLNKTIGNMEKEEVAADQKTFLKI